MVNRNLLPNFSSISFNRNTNYSARPSFLYNAATFESTKEMKPDGSDISRPENPSLGVD